MLSSNIDWVFFDLGDTLIDNNPVWDGMLKDLRTSLSDLGITHSFEELSALFEQISGEATPRPFNQLPGRLGLTEEQGRLATSRCVWRHDLETPIPGAKELLAALHGHYKLGVIANQAPGSVERCTYWGIAAHFDQFLMGLTLNTIGDTLYVQQRPELTHDQETHQTRKQPRAGHRPQRPGPAQDRR